MIMNICTLIFPMRGNKVLLGVKRKKILSGLLTGPGGKPENGESIHDCAVRELYEESGLRALELCASGRVEITGNGGDMDHVVIHVFTCSQFLGKPKDTHEMGDYNWYSIHDLPWDRMRASDREWLPQILAGEEVEIKIAR